MSSHFFDYLSVDVVCMLLAVCFNEFIALIKTVTFMAFKVVCLLTVSRLHNYASINLHSSIQTFAFVFAVAFAFTLYIRQLIAHFQVFINSVNTTMEAWNFFLTFERTIIQQQKCMIVLCFNLHSDGKYYYTHWIPDANCAPSTEENKVNWNISWSQINDIIISIVVIRVPTQWCQYNARLYRASSK